MYQCMQMNLQMKQLFRVSAKISSLILQIFMTFHWSQVILVTVLKTCGKSFET